MALLIAALIATSAAGCGSGADAEAVALYRDGEYDAAIEALRALGRPVEPPARTHPDESCLAASILVRTELGLVHAGQSRWSAAEDYLDRAWAVSAEMDGPQRAAFQRDWLLLVGLRYQDLIFSAEPTGAISGAERYLTQAAEHAPDDPTVLLASGAFFEWASRVGVRRRAGTAETLYLRSLRADPHLAEAHLRLGWLRLFQLGKEGAARESLAEAARLASEPILIYRAWMGLGRVAEISENWVAAARHYERAIAAAPDWQVGHTALAHARFRSGERPAARDGLGRALSIPDYEENLRGYWSYELGLAPLAPGLLDRLRAVVAP